MTHASETSKRLRISVVMPVFNSEATVRDAIKSVLAQTFEGFELIVVDDGSTDGSPQILGDEASRDPRVNVTTTPNRGVTAALNTGLSMARGEFVARMDADDLSEPMRFEKQCKHLDDHGECVAVGSGVIEIDDDGVPRRSHKFGASAKLPDRCRGFRHFPPSPPTIYHPTAMIRAETLTAAGGYRTCFRSAQDRDLWWRLSRRGEIHRLPEALLRYRVHAGAVSRRFRERSAADALMADLSAIAAHFGLDDHELLARYEVQRESASAIEEYANLLGARYPIKRLAAYRAITRGYPSIAGYRDARSILQHALTSMLRHPFEASSLRLAKAAIVNRSKSTLVSGR